MPHARKLPHREQGKERNRYYMKLYMRLKREELPPGVTEEFALKVVHELVEAHIGSLEEIDWFLGPPWWKAELAEG